MNMSKKVISVILAVAMLLMSFAALADWENDKTITVVQSSDVFVFDPCASADVNNKNCLKNMLGRLYETDEYFRPVPCLALSYEQVDELTWDFTLADNAYFNDGTKVTADDVIYCYNRVQNTKCSGQTLLKPIVEMYVTEEGKLRMVTDQVYGSMLTALSNSATAILSAEWVKKAEAGECTWEDVVRYGSFGRYILENREPGISITLVKNPNYFDQARAAQNDKLIFRIIPEATTRTIMVQTGEADLNVNFDTAQMEECLADPNVEIISFESSKVYQMWLRVDSEKLADKRVRQAIAYAINRDDCLEVGGNGLGQVWANCWAPFVKGAAPENCDYCYDPDKAMALLQEAGVSNLSITAAVKSDNEERIAQIVQLYLSMVGIDMQISRIDNAVLATEMGAGNFDACFYGSTSYDDPELFFERFYGEAGIGVGNYSHFNNAECMELLKKAEATLDEATRVQCYTEMNKIVMDEACVLGLYNDILYDQIRTGLKGVNLNTETTYWFDTIHY